MPRRYKVGDQVFVAAEGHTYHDRLYTGEAQPGSIGQIMHANDDGTYKVAWLHHDNGFVGNNDHYDPDDPDGYFSQADHSCLRPYVPVDVTSIEEVEKWLTT